MNQSSAESAHRGDVPEILLLEDDPGYLRLTREAFDMAEFDVELHTATTTDDALAFLTERANDESATYPDLLLLDLGLPGDDGFAVLEELRDDSGLPPLPAIVLTNSAAQEDVLRSYRLHASAYIQKPDSPDELAEVARAVKEFWFERVHLPPV